MKINTQEPMLDFEGLPINHVNGMPATFRSVVCDVLNMAIQQFDFGKDELHFQYLFFLGKKISSCDVVDLGEKEINIIRSRLTASAHVTSIKCRIYEIFTREEMKNGIN